MARNRRNFDYSPTYEATIQRAERQSSMYDNIFKNVKLFKAGDGNNTIRILPPTWDKAQHYGYRVFVHYGIGPREARYLCLKENKDSPYKRCPICEELYTLGQKATVEDRKQLMPREQIVYYVLDRNNPQNGVMVWQVSPTADSEIAAQSVNRRKGSVLNIVDPKNGYDIDFHRSGQRLNTRYRGYQVVREDSPISDNERTLDEVVDFIWDNPLPAVLNFYKPEHIEEVYYGKTSGTSDEAEEEQPRQRSRARNGEDDEPPFDTDEEQSPRRPATRRAEPEEDEEEETPRTRGRRSVGEEIDDEIPEEPRERPARSARVQPDDEDEEEEPETRRPPPRRTRNEDDDNDDDRSAGRERMRNRLRR